MKDVLMLAVLSGRTNIEPGSLKATLSLEQVRGVFINGKSEMVTSSSRASDSPQQPKLSLLQPEGLPCARFNRAVS